MINYLNRHCMGPTVNYHFIFLFLTFCNQGFGGEIKWQRKICGKIKMEETRDARPSFVTNLATRKKIKC